MTGRRWPRRELRRWTAVLAALGLSGCLVASEDRTWSDARLGLRLPLPEDWLVVRDTEQEPVLLTLAHPEWGQSFLISTAEVPPPPADRDLVAAGQSVSGAYERRTGGRLVRERDLVLHQRRARELVFHLQVDGRPVTGIFWLLRHRDRLLILSSHVPGEHRLEDADAWDLAPSLEFDGGPA